MMSWPVSSCNRRPASNTTSCWHESDRGCKRSRHGWKNGRMSAEQNRCPARWPATTECERATIVCNSAFKVKPSLSSGSATATDSMRIEAMLKMPRLEIAGRRYVVMEEKEYEHLC